MRKLDWTPVQNTQHLQTWSFRVAQWPLCPSPGSRGASCRITLITEPFFGSCVVWSQGLSAFLQAAPRRVEAGQPVTERPLVDTYYDHEELWCRPYVSPDADIPDGLLTLAHSFGYDCQRRANLQLLDEYTLGFIAGSFLILLDVRSGEQRYICSCSGEGIGAIVVHPSQLYLAVAEKGRQPSIVIYEWPSLKPCRVLRGGAAQAYSSLAFDREGTLLASVSAAPDYMLTLWAWRDERVVLRSKAFSQDVYRVSFSPDSSGQLTTSGTGHIKFWKMASTFTGLKLEGLLGKFGKTALTDIEGYVELPDGKVVSGSEWGNMLLWDGGLIKVEICRKGGRPCHSGAICQLVFDEGELLTIGRDGAIRGWDFESIEAADCADDSGLFEVEPMNEMMIGRGVCLSSMVKSTQSGSFIWFAQDSNGAIWKLDLSFSNITQDPEVLFSFHSGPIVSMDVSSTSHLMATTALDRSVRVFDFLTQKQVACSRFGQNGITVSWEPCRGGLLAVGFEDGVLRLLEVSIPQSMCSVEMDDCRDDAQLQLRQAMKPHNGPISAIAFQAGGNLLATGSTDGMVFFMMAGHQYEAVGFVSVPGPVQCLEWSPSSHERKTLLVLCQNGHAVEVEAPEPGTQKYSHTYELHHLHRAHFHFTSIKSRIRRDMEIARRIAERQKRREDKEQQDEGEKEEEEGLRGEEEENLPPLYIPNPPSPLLCGFYSQPGSFWVSMGGFDAGFLYHCRFSEQQEVHAEPRCDEPFAFVPLEQVEDDTVHCFSFSFTRQLLLCGMGTGHIRAYPLQPGDLHLTSMKAFWDLGIHDNQRGGVRSVRCSHDDQFVLTAGNDGNIFSFRLLSQGVNHSVSLGQAAARSAPLPLHMEKVAQDIEDPHAYSLETAKQRAELDRVLKEAERRKEKRRRKLAELQKEFGELLQRNEDLPVHARLRPTELGPDRYIQEKTEQMTSKWVAEVQRKLAWERERCRFGLRKLQERFWNPLESDTITVVGFHSLHRISTYRLLVQSNEQKICSTTTEPERTLIETEMEQEGIVASAQAAVDIDPLWKHDGFRPQPQPPGSGTGRLTTRQAQKLIKSAEKVDRARAKIQQRRKEWADLLASKPSEALEDPQDVQAIQHALENIGDFKLKNADDFSVPEHQRMTTGRKRAQLVALEEEIHRSKTEMNHQIVKLHDSKLQLLSQLCLQMEQLQAVQAQLPPSSCVPLPCIPDPLPEETTHQKLQASPSTLRRLQALCAGRAQCWWNGVELGLLELLEQEGEDQSEHIHIPSSNRSPMIPRDSIQLEGHDLTELEKEMRYVEEMKLLHMQDSLVAQMLQDMWQFDAQLKLLRHAKLNLDVKLKLWDLRHVTLYQELLLLKEFEKREGRLQGALNRQQEERRLLASKLEECRQQLQLKQRDKVRLQEQEKILMDAFHSLLGQDSKWDSFLTKVFRKKNKQEKPVEQGQRGQVTFELVNPLEEWGDSDEDSEGKSHWGYDEEDSDSESASVDDSACPPDCDPALFQSTLQLRDSHLELEELLTEQRKNSESLRKECDTLVDKETVIQSSLEAIEGDLELLNREKQQKMNLLDVVVPLRLNQIEFLNNGQIPNKLSRALVLNTPALEALQERIRQLQVDKIQQRALYREARQQHIQLTHDCKQMEARIHELEVQSEELMLKKFGRLVDLEALQTLSGSRTLEELRQQRNISGAASMQEMEILEEEAERCKQVLTEVTRLHTQALHSMTDLLAQKKDLEERLNTRQAEEGALFQDPRPEVEQDRKHLCQLVQAQEQEMKSLRQEMGALLLKGAHVPPPGPLAS